MINKNNIAGPTRLVKVHVEYDTLMNVPHDAETLELLKQYPVLDRQAEVESKSQFITDCIYWILTDVKEAVSSCWGAFRITVTPTVDLGKIKPHFHFEYFGGSIDLNPVKVSNLLAEFTYKDRKFIYHFCDPECGEKEIVHELSMYDDTGNEMEPDALYHELQELNIFDYDSLGFLSQDNQEELKEA